ncbi:hypothetical protein CSUI_002642 [Cystoisospora suis]|uniref:SRS domain-containing protein n=1 Tax=Cystoisospora suis TaxID=483139 RepID=A0A2C6L8E7_9APIC|nr:hypothetical protein CSUI_002642 [Cystoisospora suis]
MDRHYFFRWALLALAVTAPGIIVTEALGHAGATVPMKGSDKSPRLQSSQGRQVLGKDLVKPEECNKTTTEDKPVMTVTIDEKSLQAKFTCGNAFASGTVPEIGTSPRKCCKDAACPSENEVDISNILDVDGKAELSNHTVTVTVAKVPDNKRGEKFYYKCKGSDNTCLVAVALPSSLPDNECAIDRTVELSLSAPQTTVEFKCNGELVTTPIEVKTGASCTGGQATNKLLQLDDSKAQNHTYTLSVAKLPNATTKLCYKCVYEGVPQLSDTTKTETRTCSVMVTVAKATPESSETSTSTAPTSAASIAYKSLGGVTLGAISLSALAAN